MRKFSRFKKLLILLLICGTFSVFFGYENQLASDSSRLNWLWKSAGDGLESAFARNSVICSKSNYKEATDAHLTTSNAGTKEAIQLNAVMTAAKASEATGTKTRSSETRKPQNSETTKPRSSETTALQKSETTEPWNSDSRKPRISKTIEQWNSENRKPWNSVIMKTRKWENTKPRNSGTTKRRNSETTEPRISENTDKTPKEEKSTSQSRFFPPKRPIDGAFIDSHFAELKQIFHNHTRLTGHWKRVDELMKARRPVMNSSSWSLHSPSGQVYSHEELLTIGNGDGQLAVPNVAHFILPFGNTVLQFHHSVCILSCVWIMRPRLLFLWHSRLPTGPHWLQLRLNLTAAALWNSTVVLARRSVPSDIYGQPVHKLEHKSDLMRLEAVLAFGGAYFDLDVITLKPLTPLRRFNFTIGRQSADGLCNGVFLGAPNSTFLALWHLAYQVFDSYKWSALSVNLPHFMCAEPAFKQLCQVEEDSMDKPTWNQHDVIYKPTRKWPWHEKNYVMHLWYRFHPVQYNLTSICTVDSTLGDMFRFVLFGNETNCY